MAFAFKVKEVRCPNCNYEGKAQIKGSGGGLVILFLILFFVSFLFPPLFIVAGIMFLWLLLKQAKQICPKCKFENPIPK